MVDGIKKTLRESAFARWSILVLVGFLMASNYYFYDAISPLKRILEQNFGFTSSDFGLFLFAYTIPNSFLLMTVFGGIILDRMGIRRTGFAFTFLMTIGAFITAYGVSGYYNNGGPGYHFMGSFLTAYSPTLKMMFIGRFLFGLGAETSIVVINKILVKWFKGREIAFAFAVNLVIARLGNAAAFNLSPRLAECSTGWTTAVWFGATLVGTGLLTFVAYMLFDLKLDRQISQQRLLDKEEEFHFSDLVALAKNKSYIYITALCVTFYSAVFPFQSYAADFFVNKYHVSLNTGGFIASFLSYATIPFTPLFGWLVDKKGKSATLMIYGSLLLVLVHLTFGLTRFSPHITTALLGIAFSLVPAAMWPAVARIVDENKLGTAYGVMSTIQNLGFGGLQYLVGIVLDRTNPGVTAEAINNGTASYNYTYAILMLALLGFVGLIFAFLLKREDKVSGYGLELPSNAGEDRSQKTEEGKEKKEASPL